MTDVKKKKVPLLLHVDPSLKTLVEKLAGHDDRSTSSKGEQVLKLGLETDVMASAIAEVAA